MIRVFSNGCVLSYFRPKTVLTFGTTILFEVVTGIHEAVKAFLAQKAVQKARENRPQKAKRDQILRAMRQEFKDESVIRQQLSNRMHERPEITEIRRASLRLNFSEQPRTASDKGVITSGKRGKVANIVQWLIPLAMGVVGELLIFWVVNLFINNSVLAIGISLLFWCIIVVIFYILPKISRR